MYTCIDCKQAEGKNMYGDVSAGCFCDSEICAATVGRMLRDAGVLNIAEIRPVEYSEATIAVSEEAAKLVAERAAARLL